jgi:hypothetical protein
MYSILLQFLEDVPYKSSKHILICLFFEEITFTNYDG